MNLYLAEDNEFIERLSKIILENLGNENFGVTEFINATGLNDYYLRRRIKSIKNITINHFIIEVRLEKARELLIEGTYTAAEVSYNVGFNSPTYFNKCFHEHFGYPPGDIKKRTVDIPISSISESEHINTPNTRKGSKIFFISRNAKLIYITVPIVLVAGIVFILFFQNPSFFKSKSVEKSVAVLPFKNLSENEENQYFADGVVEDILDRLTKISELKVVSRTSVEQFRESKESAPEIGKKLGVNYLLEGSVQRHDGKVRITIQLIDAKEDKHILSEKIDRDMEDILALESDIAKLVADQLQAVISPEEKQQIEKVHTHNTEAYDYYLMGRYYWNLRSFKSLTQSLEYFEKAIAADSTYALAYAGLADAYYNLAIYDPDPVRCYDKAFELAKKALEINENLPEAYAVLGGVYSNGYWQWEESKKYFEKAMAIDSNNLVTLSYYASLLNTIGEFDAARNYIDHAIELAPYSARIRRLSTQFYYEENKGKEAIHELSMVEGKLLEQSDQEELMYRCYLKAGDTVAALQLAQKYFATSLSSEFTEFRPLANQVFPTYKSSGLKGIYKMMYNNPPNYWLAVNMDSIDAAIRYLRIACENRSPSIYYFVLSHDFVKLHNDPRFLEIVDKTHLTPYYNLRYKK